MIVGRAVLLVLLVRLVALAGHDRLHIPCDRAPPLAALLIDVRRTAPRVKAIHHAVFELVGVGDGVALVEADDAIELVADAANQAIGKHRLDQVLEARRAIVVGVGLGERRWANVYGKLRVVTRLAVVEHAILRPQVEQTHQRIISRAGRVKPRVGQRRGEAVGVERRHRRVEAACVICLTNAQARRDGDAGDGRQRHSKPWLKIKALHGSRRRQHIAAVNDLLALERAEGGVE